MSGLAVGHARLRRAALPIERTIQAVSARSKWPVRVFTLGGEPGDDLSAATSAEERLAMVSTLTLEAWSMSGRPIPDYGRRETPIARRPWPPPRAASDR